MGRIHTERRQHRKNSIFKIVFEVELLLFSQIRMVEQIDSMLLQLRTQILIKRFVLSGNFF